MGVDSIVWPSETQQGYKDAAFPSYQPCCLRCDIEIGWMYMHMQKHMHMCMYMCMDMCMCMYV